MNQSGKVIIVHCWGGNPDHCWYPQTKRELEAKLIIKHKMGHFSGPADQPGSCISLPDITESILEMTEEE